MALSTFKSLRLDPRNYIARRGLRDKRILSMVHFMDEGNLRRAGLNEPLNADGIYYRDSRTPFMIASQTGITLAATDKLLYPGAMTALVANYLTPGKKLKLTVFGAFTTVLTPGNIGVEIYLGGTTDAGGTLMASSGAVALTASKTSISCSIEVYLQMRTSGISTVASALAWGRFMSDGASLLTASASNPLMIPASAPAQVATGIDTTVSGGFNVQIKRSGSTAETFTTHDLIFEALN